jgi:hypothetical protein
MGDMKALLLATFRHVAPGGATSLRSLGDWVPSSNLSAPITKKPRGSGAFS